MEATTTTTTEATQNQTTETAPAKQNEPAATTTQAAKEKLKLLVDGQEIEREIDWNDRESLKKELQLAAAAKKRMGEAGTLKTQAMQIMKAWESGDHSILAKHPKGREIAEAFLMSQIEAESLTPEQKLQKEKDERLKRFEDKEKQEEEGKKSAAQQKRETELIQSFQKTIIDAIDKTGLPKSPDLVKRMAGLLQKNLKLGIDLSPEDLAQEVKSETMGMLKAVMGNATGAQLIEMFGPDLAKQIRKHDIENLKAKANGGFPPKKDELPPPAKPEKGYMTTDEWKADLEKRIQNVK